MKTGTNTAKLIFLSLIPSLMWPQAGQQTKESAGLPNLKVLCSTSGDTCSLVEPASDVRYQTLALAFVSQNNSVALSADLLAAVLRTTDHGKQRRWIPPIFFKTIPRLEEDYRIAKTYPVAPEDGTAFVVVNIPGVGAKMYDADVIRMLLPTEIFPNRLHLVNRHNNGARGEYVALLRNPATDSLVESFKNGTKEAIKNASDQASKNGLFLLAAALNGLPVGSEPINFGPEVTLTAYEKLPVEQKQLEGPHRVDWTGCDVQFKLSVPRRPSSSYQAIELHAKLTLPNDALANGCGPPKAGIVGVSTTESRGCEQVKEAVWDLYGTVLEQNVPKQPPFRFFAEYPPEERGKQVSLQLFLVGHAKGSHEAVKRQPVTLSGECK